ncbi:Chitinase 2 [Hypoxylon texense]
METSDWDHSYFSFWRSPSKVEACDLQPEPDKYNFLSFLATAQTMRITFLPVIWDSVRQSVGVGGTSRVQDMLVTLETSFAFKIYQKRNKTEEQIFRTLINEATILSQDSIREHPNVARLQGICWDISSNDDIPWPVLVFEKSHLGDLEHFSRYEGRDITMAERLRLCVDIGRAVRDMHANSIVHGDIKPENVLIFQDESGRYQAKIIDFGYSGQYADSDHPLSLFGTELWNAPEHKNHTRQWTFQEATRADLFSFGMLCLWLLFEPYISGRVSSLPQSLRSANTALSRSGFDTLRTLKEAGALRTCAQQLLSLDAALDQGNKSALEEFFESSLNPEDPAEREIGLSGFMARFDAQRNTLKAMLSNPKAATSVMSNDFKIEMSIYEFYRSDYRVRSYIVERLQQSQPLTTHAAIQMALCHYIGFGVRRSLAEAEKVLRETNQTLKDVRDLLSGIHEEHSVYHTSTLSSITAMGQVAWQDFTFTYLEQDRIEQAEGRLKQELDDSIAVFGEDQTISNILRYVIAQVNLTRYEPTDDTDRAVKAAEQLLLQVVKSNKARLIPDHPDTLIVESVLASVYKSQHRWKEAEELDLQIVAISRTKLGPDHPFTLAIMSNLSSTYSAQGRLKDAEQVDLQVVEACKATGRVDNTAMMTSIANLVLSYQSQGRWEDVERLNMQTLEMYHEKLGEGHPETIDSMANLAGTYKAQGKLEEAAELSSRVLRLSKDRYGTENVDTLRHICFLAEIFWEQNRVDEVEKLHAQVAEARNIMLGAAHPETLRSKLNLASAIRKQGRLEECKEVERELLETCKTSISGNTNKRKKAEVLEIMCDLASVLWGSGRFEDAEELELEIVETYKSELGRENPFTIRRITYLASRYKDLGRWEEAQEFFTQAIAAKTDKYTVDHYDTLQSIRDLAKLHEKRCQWDEAEQLHLQLVEKRKALLGEDSGETLSSMHELAFCYAEQERWGESGDLYLEVLEKRKTLLGEEHPDTLLTMYNLAVTWKSDGWDEDALELLKECVQIRRQIFGDSHPEVILDLETLNEWTN